MPRGAAAGGLGNDFGSPQINDEFSCFKSNLTTSLALNLEKCETLLDGVDGHEEIQKARRLDESAPSQRRHIDRQKHVLNSREAVFGMLRAIQGRNPKALELFSTVRIVRRLDKIGEKNATAGA